MPELILRLRDGSRDPVDLPGSTCEVVAAVEPSHTVAELTDALAAHVGYGDGRDDARALISLRSGRVLDPTAPVETVDLLTGDEVLLAGRHTPRDATGDRARELGDPGRLVAVDVVAGPDGGRSWLLRRPGRYGVGRAADAAVRLDDPSVSRHHATLVLDAAGTTVRPRSGAANGVLVNGDEITVPTVLAATDVVTLGATRVAVRPVPARIERDGARFGRVDIHRTPYRPTVVPAPTTEPIGPIPEHPEPRRFPVIAAVAPLAAGLAMYALTRQLHFLALTLLSPVIMVGSAVEDRRSGRRSYRRRVERFRDELVEHRAGLERLRDAERIDRLRAAPDLADLVRRAELRTIDLWARGRSAPDFLALRLGLGPATVAFAIELRPGGSDELRDEAMAALAGVDVLADVPVTVALVDVLAIHGERAAVDGVAASLLVQAATLHSPDDLTIVGALAPDRSVRWIRWLPHARSVTSPLPGDHVARSREGADRLVDHLLEVAEQRDGIGSGRSDDHEANWPRVLAVVDATLRPDAARVARLLDVAPRVGISVVWLADSAADVPRQATRTLVVRRAASGALRGHLWSTDPVIDPIDLEVEQLRPALADRVARALAPIRDASTDSLATMIPRTAPLLDVLGVGRPSAAWVVEQWQHRSPVGLRFPVGLGADGPVVLDLVTDGPHALVGGTSGAGKSELLQSMVAALAAHHPPNRLNVLFVDYKGGAASQQFERLPHTVGHVTNLSADLAARALTSLRAELHRRMTLLEGRAKDLAELVAVAPDEAPPSLVIVVDEFATLVREVPEFVAGVVDVAQRGRSLGIHLVLATQRPTGAVNDNILANTNLRISLRMLDRAESSAVVGVPDAADIPVPLRGRGLVRLGPRHLVELQCAYGGSPLLAAEVRPPVLVAPFSSTDASPASLQPTVTGVTQLDAVLDAVAEAARRLGFPAPRRPWCDVLPELVPLDRVLADPVADRARREPGRFVAFGLLDAPERQEQHAAVVDLEDGGGLLVFGSGGAGATTALRTVAASAIRSASSADGEVAVLAIDVAGRRLAAIAGLPGVVDVVTGDDLEAVTRHLLVLEGEVDRRRRLFAGAGCEHLTAYRRDHADAPVRTLVLIDGFGALVDGLVDATPAGDAWVERLARLVLDGRQVGVHTVLTADRRSAVPARIGAAVANRLVLRHADDAAYADHGISPARGRGLVPGRGWWHGPAHAEAALVQVASVSADAAARAQADALTALAVDGGRRSVEQHLRSEPLPERFDRVPPAPGGLAAVVGVVDVTGADAMVDLGWSGVTVCGPPRSGRSTALAVLATQLATGWAGPGRPVVVGGPASSPLRSLDGLPGVRGAFGRNLTGVLNGLVDGVGDGGPQVSGEPWVLVLDDLDALDAVELAPVLDRLARDDTLRLVAATGPRAGFTTNPLLAVAHRSRRMLVLRPDDPAEFLQLTGVRLVLRPGLSMPPGRGVLLVDRSPSVVQVAHLALDAVRRDAGVAP